jgi:hypothetical protein
MNATMLRGLPSLLLLLLLLPAGARGQVGGGDNPGDRILKGHTLLFPVLQPSALVSTHVGIREGIAELRADQLPLGELGPRDIQLTGLQQTIDLSIRFTPWLALFLAGEGQVIIGTNGITLLRRGAAFDTSGDAGLNLRLLRNENSGTQLSVRGFVGASKGRNLTLLPLLQSAVNAPGLTLQELLAGNLSELLLVDTKEQSFGAGIYLAQVFTPAFSLQLSSTARRTTRTESPFDAVLGSEVDEDLRTFALDTAAALTYDFAPHGVPVALLGEYRFRLGHRSGAALLSEDIRSSTVALGVYYSGRPNLQVGASAVRLFNGEPLQGSTAEDVPAESEDSRLSYAQLILRYVW